MNKQKSNAKSLVNRLPRIESYNLVEVRTNFWNPFAKHSGVLLDLTTQGFKVEFQENIKLREGAEVGLILPLAPFKIFEKTNLKVNASIKWFDKTSFRAGGTFTSIDEEKIFILNRVIAFLKEKDQFESAS